ncbi:MAG: hypothetical protein U1D30_04000 [Planctomycetota bacterium]
MASIVYLVLWTAMVGVTTIVVSRAAVSYQDQMAFLFASPKLDAVPITSHPSGLTAIDGLGLRADFGGCRHAGLWSPLRRCPRACRPARRTT